jgi:FkbM family methyltransferase
MSRISYAQNFEDVRLWRAFADVPAGRYLDIGAQDPVRDSVSLTFYEHGWRGVHVEPTPTYADAIRAARPDELVIEAAVSTDPGPLTFFEIPATGLSTGRSDIADRHAAEGWRHHIITVPTITLARLFERMGDALIHWMKIDVEGMEADVLTSWGDHPARPAALVIEATAPNTQTPTHAAWHALVTGRGYREVAFDGLSRFFVHADHADRAEALALCPNVFDGFNISPTHFAAAAVLESRDRDIAALGQQFAQAQAGLAAAEGDKARLAGRIAEQRAAHKAAIAAEKRASKQLLAEVDTRHARELARLQTQAAKREEEHARLTTALSEATSLLAETRAARAAEAAASAAAAAETDRRIKELNASLIKAQAEALAAARDARAAEAAQAAAAARHIDMLEGRLSHSEAQVAEMARQLGAAREQAAASAAQAAAVAAETEQLRGVIARQQAQLGAAAELLALAPDPLAGWPGALARGVLRLAGRGRSAAIAAHAGAVARWQAELAGNRALPGGELSLAGNIPAAETAALHGGVAMAPDAQPITSVPPLLALHDRAFVVAAYQALLGRAPDPEGEAYYLARLRAGTHKLVILRQLRQSPEGRAFIPGVAGLDRAIKRHRLANLPVVGAVVRLFTGAEGDNAVQRQLRVLANEMGRQRAEQPALLAAISRLVVQTPAAPQAVVHVTPEAHTNSNAPAPVNHDALPPLAATLGAAPPADGFDDFLSSLRSALAASREAAILRQR